VPLNLENLNNVELGEKLNFLYNRQEIFEHIESKEEQKNMFSEYLDRQNKMGKQDINRIANIWDDDGGHAFNVVENDPFLEYGAGVAVYFVLQRNLIKLFTVLSIFAII
jgi:hypothetical protein